MSFYLNTNYKAHCFEQAKTNDFDYFGVIGTFPKWQFYFHSNWSYPVSKYRLKCDIWFDTINWIDVKVREIAEFAVDLYWLFYISCVSHWFQFNIKGMSVWSTSNYSRHYPHVQCYLLCMHFPMHSLQLLTDDVWLCTWKYASV